MADISIDIAAVLGAADDAVEFVASLLNELAVVGHRRATADERRDVRSAFDHMMVSLSGEIDDLRLSSDVRTQIEKIADIHDPKWTTARGIAEAVDRIVGHRFWEMLEGERQLKPGDPVCCSRPDPSRLVGIPSVNPLRLDEGIWWHLPHLRIAPDSVSDIDTFLSVTPPVALNAMEGPATFVVPQTERHVADFDIAERDDDTFFGVTPSVTRDEVESLAVQAAALAADVVMFPELCVEEEAAESLLGRFSVQDPPPLVVVAGSHHVDTDGHRENRAPWWVADDVVPTVQTKHAPFVWNPDGVERVEGIDSPDRPVLRIRSSGQFLIAVLICRDAIHPPIVDLVRELGVNLLCIPAFTPRTDPFNAEAATHAARNQTFTFIANTPAESEVTGAVTVPAKVGGQRSFGSKDHPDINDGNGLLRIRTRGDVHGPSDQGRIVSEWFPSEG